ncbi:MAG: o-succinylbenzoate synthase [Aureliella sp.]
MTHGLLPLDGVKAYRFRIKLVSELNLKGGLHRFREGVLLERDGYWAEASPLPGFSRESIGDVISALRGEQTPPASLRFAWTQLETPIKAPIEVPFNRLLLGDANTILDSLKQPSAASCPAVKLKVGRGNLHSELQLVRRVRDRLPQNTQLRLDANRAWTFEQAQEAAEHLSGIDLDYIEEPLTEPGRLEELHKLTGLRYALDETLIEGTNLSDWPNAVAMICKPTILGGRDAILRLADTGKPVVFSAAFESGIGIAHIVQLASEFSPHLPAGLDTLDWLSEDLLEISPTKNAGMLRFEQPPQARVIGLEPISL